MIIAVSDLCDTDILDCDVVNDDTRLGILHILERLYDIKQFHQYKDLR